MPSQPASDRRRRVARRRPSAALVVAGPPYSAHLQHLTAPHCGLSHRLKLLEFHESGPDSAQVQTISVQWRGGVSSQPKHQRSLSKTSYFSLYGDPVMPSSVEKRWHGVYSREARRACQPGMWRAVQVSQTAEAAITKHSAWLERREAAFALVQSTSELAGWPGTSPPAAAPRCKATKIRAASSALRA